MQDGEGTGNTNIFLGARLRISFPGVPLHWSHVGDSGQTSANRGYAVRGNDGILVESQPEKKLRILEIMGMQL